MWSHCLPEGSWGSNKLSTFWKVKILGKLGQRRRRVMVTYFILHFCQTWKNAVHSAVTCAQVKRWWVAFLLWEGVELRLWGDRIISEVHEHTSTIFQWHPGTSVRTKSLSPVVEKNVIFFPKSLDPKWARQAGEREFSPWITKRDLGPPRSQVVLPSISRNSTLGWGTDWAQE